MLQDVRAGHVRHFHRVVGVLDARARGRQVGDGGAQVGDGGVEAVLHRAQRAAKLIDLGQCRVDRRERIDRSRAGMGLLEGEAAVFGDEQLLTDVGRVGIDALGSRRAARHLVGVATSDGRDLAADLVEFEPLNGLLGRRQFALGINEHRVGALRHCAGSTHAQGGRENAGLHANGGGDAVHGRQHVGGRCSRLVGNVGGSGGLALVGRAVHGERNARRGSRSAHEGRQVVDRGLRPGTTVVGSRQVAGGVVVQRIAVRARDLASGVDLDLDFLAVVLVGRADGSRTDRALDAGRDVGAGVDLRVGEVATPIVSVFRGGDGEGDRIALVQLAQHVGRGGGRVLGRDVVLVDVGAGERGHVRTGQVVHVGGAVLHGTRAIHVEAIQTQSLGADFLQIDVDGLAVVGTHLDRQLAGVGRQHLHAVELGLFRHAVDFVQALGDFSLDRIQVAGRVRAVGSLHRQFADALQVVVHFGQGAFGRLSDRDAVVGVAGRLGQALDVRGEAVRNRLASCVVLGAVDAQARRQTLDRRVQRRLRSVHVVLSHQRQRIGINDLRHLRLLYAKFLAFRLLAP
ncbi:hypothetical protein FQZ97_684730 [compost metagenome]